MDLHRNELDPGEVADAGVVDLDTAAVPSLRPPVSGSSIHQLDTLPQIEVVSAERIQQGLDVQYDSNDWSLHDVPTWILPIVRANPRTKIARKLEATLGGEGQVAHLRKLVTSSGIYALSTMALPLVTLVLAPFLTHKLSPTDYGILAVINTAIGLLSGISQLGLFSAFFRAYNYDYSSLQDRQAVVTTVTALLCLVSFPVGAVVGLTSPFLAAILLGRSSLAGFVGLAGGVVLLQNLTIPGLAWLRAEGRPVLYSLLSISNLLITLLATIFLVGVLHWGVAGAIIANGAGYACIVVCSLPVIIARVGIRIRVDIARGLLAFGLPLVLNFASFWVLQLSDRYLLSILASLGETARYSVVNTLGSAITVVVMGPFNLAWPATMFAIAKRKDAAHIFALVFRWLGLFLFFAAFSLSLLAIFLLDLLFPVSYRTAAPIIPVIAASWIFYGVYAVLMAGANIKRKTWLTAVFATAAAVVNVALNLLLIPHYGAMGAAASTLIAFMLMAAIAYIVNQRIYPVPYEIGRFTFALCLGVAFYVGSSFLAQPQEAHLSWGIYILALCLYGVCLALLGKLPALRRDVHNKEQRVQEKAVL